MSIIGTYFRKEELSIINPFVSQRMGKGIRPVATSKKFVYTYLKERQSYMNIYYF